MRAVQGLYYINLIINHNQYFMQNKNVTALNTPSV